MFGKRNKKVIKAIWSVLVVFIIISMVMLYTPIFFGGHGGGAPQEQQNQPIDLPDQTITITDDGVVADDTPQDAPVPDSNEGVPASETQIEQPAPNLDFSPI